MVVTTLGHTHHSTTAGFSFSWCLPEICCIFIGTFKKQSDLVLTDSSREKIETWFLGLKTINISFSGSTLQIKHRIRGNMELVGFV